MNKSTTTNGLVPRQRDCQTGMAGFSQGGKAVVELLKTMPADAMRRLVAAYVLGYKVTPADTLDMENIWARVEAYYKDKQDL